MVQRGAKVATKAATKVDAKQGSHLHASAF